MTRKEYPRIGEAVCTTVLDNGLNIMVTPKKGWSKSYAFFAANYGSIDTGFKKGGRSFSSPDGVAHYLEHKMFDTKDGNALQLLAQNGASPNAFTSFDMTAYHFESTEKFYENLEILLSFVSEGYFTEESVEKERGIIAQEIKMYEDSPSSAVMEELLKLLYVNSNVRVPIAGTVESIADITAETLYSCHEAFYDPANMLLCCVGDIEPEKVVETAKRILPKGSGEAPERERSPEPPQSGGARTEKSMEVSMPMFMLGFKNPQPGKGEAWLREELVGELAAELLMGASSPLYERLYASGLINTGFYSGWEGFAGVGFLVAGGDSRDPDRVMSSILEEAESIVGGGVDEARFERLKKAQFGRRLREYNSFSDICYRQSTAFFNGADYGEIVGIFDSIRSEDVRAFLELCVRQEQGALSVITPRTR